LLTGIVIGSGVSIFYLLKSNLEHPFLLIEEKIHIGDTLRITLPDQVSFLNKAKINSLLRKIPQGEKVIIDATHNHYLDPDVVEIFQDFVFTEAHKRRIKVNVLGMPELGEENDHLEFTNTLDKERQQSLRPVEILELLKEGNQRFMEGAPSSKQFDRQVQDTSGSQNPMAVLISCIDSRTSPELILDASPGDLISIRIAGNIVSHCIVGSVELACLEMGVRLIIVMGHSNCGAIIQAMKPEQPGNLKWISDEIKPAITSADIRIVELEGQTEALNQISMLNLRNSVKKLTAMSPYIQSEMENGNLGLVAAFYDTKTGKVTFDKLEEVKATG
jgi:carbonic anhydrase